MPLWHSFYNGTVRKLHKELYRGPLCRIHIMHREGWEASLNGSGQTHCLGKPKTLNFRRQDQELSTLDLRMLIHLFPVECAQVLDRKWQRMTQSLPVPVLRSSSSSPTSLLPGSTSIISSLSHWGFLLPRVLAEKGGRIWYNTANSFKK